MAWARGGNGRWRHVEVIGDGFMEKIEVGSVPGDSLHLDVLTQHFVGPHAAGIQCDLDERWGNYERDFRTWMW
jgi:hypothetical protein